MNYIDCHNFSFVCFFCPILLMTPTPPKNYLYVQFTTSSEGDSISTMRLEEIPLLLPPSNKTND